MEIFRKVITKERTPTQSGLYLTREGARHVHVYPSMIYWGQPTTQAPPEFWLEQINLGDLKFDKEDASQEFVDGINYILNQLK